MDQMKKKMKKTKQFFCDLSLSEAKKSMPMPHQRQFLKPHLENLTDPAIGNEQFGSGASTQSTTTNNLDIWNQPQEAVRMMNIAGASTSLPVMFSPLKEMKIFVFVCIKLL